jgi:hypothetical protein
VAVRRAAILLVLMACMTAPPVAGAAPVAIGMAATLDGYGPVGEEAALIAATGARWVREDLDWAQVQPRPGTWEWSAPDLAVRAAAEHGLRVLPILDGTPCWAASAGTSPADCARSLPADEDAYATFAAAAAARYGPGGTFWALSPDLDANLASAWVEVFNEPYFTGSTSTIDPARYARLFRAVAIAGRAANPATRWLVATTTEARTEDGSPVDWAAALAAAAPDLGAHADGLAIHVYPGDAAPGGRIARFVEEAVRRFASQTGGTPAVWITELGYSACAPPAPAARCVPGATRAVREEGKARWLEEGVAELAGIAAVQAVFIYTLREWDAPYFGQLGLLDERLAPLPAFTAIARAAAAAGDLPPPAFGWPPRDPLQAPAVG